MADPVWGDTPAIPAPMPLASALAAYPAPDILTAASARYPFIKQHNMVVFQNPQKDRGYAETWPIGEQGDPKYARPADIPLDRHGIEIYRPGEFGIDDLAGEVMHIDPRVNGARDTLAKSLTPQQIKALRNESADYDMSVKQYGMSHEDALRNATDALLRGHVVGQWPQDAVGRIGLDKNQQAILNEIHQYVRGK